MFYTVTEPAQAAHKVQRSEFIAFLFPIKTPEEARELIGDHDKKYADATHNCFAYIIGEDRQTQYYSDAGEPGGTAGKPILNALLRAELTNVLAIVTRYYGGVKLGVRGLIDAYGDTVRDAIASAKLEEFVQLCSLQIECDYSSLELIRHRAAEWKLRMGESSYAELASMQVSLPLELKDAFCQFLDGLKIQKHLDYIEL